MGPSYQHGALVFERGCEKRRSCVGVLDFEGLVDGPEMHRHEELVSTPTSGKPVMAVHGAAQTFGDKP